MSNEYGDEDHFSFRSIFNNPSIEPEPLDVQLERSLKSNVFKYCKIRLKFGIVLVSIWEFLLWTICMGFTIYGLGVWTSPQAQKLDVRQVYDPEKSDDYEKIKIGFILLIVLFGLQALIAIVLFFAVILKARILCIIWMISSLILKLILLGICVGVPITLVYLLFIPIFLIWVVELWHVFMHWKILIRVKKHEDKFRISPKRKKFLEDALKSTGDNEDDRTVIDVSSINSDKSYGFHYGKRQKTKKYRRQNQNQNLILSNIKKK